MEATTMTDVFITGLLCVVVAAGTLSILFKDLYVSVILLSIFSFLSSLLFYVSHAPDVAITEAAVGAGMTTLIFVWAVHACSTRSPQTKEFPKTGGIKLSAGVLIDVLLVAAVGIALCIFLPPLQGTPSFLRDFLFENGYKDTGALNLVSAVYLGYRAFDTFGETIVLLCAVTGSIYFLSRAH
ncbi:MAG: hydrogen gas-evolving membrane-bound hydrogenase subunit E [Spirochaetia bacterium]|nr:hydrogen gas-evolving membrane-bound hydrogenase subunit E [Spirochaetia bacterium]